jgi:hypothetical protein
LQSWRGGLEEVVTWIGAFRHATKRRGDAETVPMRAYVTGGDPPPVTTRKPAMRARYGLTPRRVASSRLTAHERREGLCARTACWRRSRGRARMKAGDACAVLQASRQLRWQRSERRVARWSPSFRRGRAKQHAHGQSRRSHYAEVAPDVAILRQAQNRYAATDALASTTEATRQHRSVSRRTRRSR